MLNKVHVRTLLLFGLCAPYCDAAEAQTSKSATFPIAVPATNPGMWSSNDDYPTSALRNREEGRVEFRVLVNADGRPSQCIVLHSSGSQALDDATCATVMRRARFAPPRKIPGQPNAGIFTSSVAWKVPSSVPPASAYTLPNKPSGSSVPFAGATSAYSDDKQKASGPNDVQQAQIDRLEQQYRMICGDGDPAFAAMCAGLRSQIDAARRSVGMASGPSASHQAIRPPTPSYSRPAQSTGSTAFSRAYSPPSYAGSTPDSTQSSLTSASAVQHSKSPSMNHCISFDRQSNSLTDFMINNCNEKLEVKFYSDGAGFYQGDGETYVGANSKSSIGNLKGSIRFAACIWPDIPIFTQGHEKFECK